MTSLMCAPLIARGRVLGAITLLSDRPDRLFDEEDLVTTEELARRAAVAVDNALLFDAAERRADAARVLEHIADGVFLLDADGVIRLWNRAAETVTNLLAADVVGRPADEAIPGWAAIADRVPVRPLLLRARPRRSRSSSGARGLALDRRVGFSEDMVSPSAT